MIIVQFLTITVSYLACKNVNGVFEIFRPVFASDDWRVQVDQEPFKTCVLNLDWNGDVKFNQLCIKTNITTIQTYTLVCLPDIACPGQTQFGGGRWGH